EKMGILSDAFIALPGGYGTFDELFEVLSWCQLGLSSKPVGLLNVGGYFDPLLTMLDHSVAEGFLREEHRNCLISSDDPEELLSQMLVFQPAKVEKWIDRLKQKGY
ncbi:MAG: TIGR00730 family Rossman fold protein, partial [Bacteroidetes bacterium]|nr:TIGR00730 family Rossman fold protein [Bacteroidota bacterium]